MANWEKFSISLADYFKTKTFSKEEAIDFIQKKFGLNLQRSWSAMIDHKMVYYKGDNYIMSDQAIQKAKELSWLIDHKISFVCELDPTKKGECIVFDKEAEIKINKIYFNWKQNCENYVALGCRKPTLPEPISECLTCYLNNWGRTDKCKLSGFSSSSGDAVDIKTGEVIQIKGITTEHFGKASEAGPSSFGPKSQFDKLIVIQVVLSEDKAYFFDLPIDDYQEWMVNTSTTFEEQALSGKRPRLNLLNKIDEKQIKPYLVYNFTKEIYE